MIYEVREDERGVAFVDFRRQDCPVEYVVEMDESPFVVMYSYGDDPEEYFSEWLTEEDAAPFIAAARLVKEGRKIEC